MTTKLWIIVKNASYGRQLSGEVFLKYPSAPKRQLQQVVIDATTKEVVEEEGSPYTESFNYDLTLCPDGVKALGLTKPGTYALDVTVTPVATAPKKKKKAAKKRR
jgi:hypothetical protein